MDDERIDLTALDPWRDPARLRDVSQAIVQAHRETPRRPAFHALLASLATRALLTAALATLLAWLLPHWLQPRTSAAPVPSTAVLARWAERGHRPTGLELLQISEVSDGK